MPVILPGPDAEQQWLDHGTPLRLVHDLMAPLPDRAVAAREVGYAVSDARHDEPDCLDPPPAPEPDAEPTLF